MALTFDEIIPLLGDVSAVVAAGEAASKAVPAEATDLENACAIIKAVIPPLCDIVVKVEKDMKD